MFLLIPFEHSPIRVHHFSLFHWLSHDFLSHRVPSLPTFRGPPHDFLSHRVPDFSHSDDFLMTFSPAGYPIYLHFVDFYMTFSSASHYTAHFLMTSSSLSPPRVITPLRSHYLSQTFPLTRSPTPHIFYIPSWQIPLWGIYCYQNHHTPTGYLSE